jgi:hypothetical protein
MDLAPRKDSRKRSELFLRLLNSTSLMISRVQERIEQASRPTITTFTTRSACSNITMGVSLPLALPPTLRPSAPSVPWSAAGAAGAALSAGAAAGAGAGVWAMTAGALDRSATAPINAMMGEVRFISSICGRFLIDLALKRWTGSPHARLTRITALLVLRRGTFGNPFLRRQGGRRTAI